MVERSLGRAAAQSVERSQMLMAATVDLLQTSGDNVTVQEIADRAGLSLRVLYKHFPSKDALLIAVLEELLGKAADDSRTELGDVDDPVERLAVFILRTIDFPATPLNCALARNAILLPLSNPDEVRRAQAPMAELAADLVRDAAGAGHVDPGAVAGGAYLLLELRRSYNHSRLFGSELGLPLPPVADQVRFCLRALGIDDDLIEPAVAAATARRDEAA